MLLPSIFPQAFVSAERLALVASGSCLHVQLTRSLAAAAKAKKGSVAKGKQQQKGGAAAGKKGRLRQKLDVRPYDEKDSHNQRIISMLAPQKVPQHSYAAEELEAFKQRAKEFARLKGLEHMAWRTELTQKLRLKKAALAALPPALRAEAEKEDLEPFPLTRHYYYDTPPDAYRD